MENYKLLVVDDAFFIRNLIKKAISNKPKNENFSISVIGEAKNAKEALEFCENENPDIITVDYQMPPGENGVQLIKELKQKYPNKIFLMISDELNIEKEVLSLGCKFLVKPFREDVLWDRLDQAILAHLKEQLNNKQIITDNDKTVEKKIEKVKPITETVSNENKKEDTHMDDKSEIIQPTKKKKKKKKKKNPKSELELEFGFEIAGSLKKEPKEQKEPKKESMSNSINQLSKDNEKNQEVEIKTDIQTEKNTKIETVDEFPKQLDSTVENNLEPKIKPTIENNENLNTNSTKDNNKIVSKNEKVKEQKELEIQKEEEDDCLSLDFANISIDEKTEKLIDDKEEQTSKEIVDTNDINQKEEDLNDEILIDSESDENPLFDEDYISKNESEKIEEKETEIVDTDTDTDNDDPYYIDDDDDVFTFYEEDESEYEDKDIDKFQADSVEPKSIVDESEELTEDQELEALIKEASYSIDDETKVIPERTKKSKLILDDDPDIFVSEDTQTDMESFNNSYESETKDFDSMLEDFEKSDDFKKAEADVDQFDLFEQNLNQIDENNFELDEEDEKDEKDEEDEEDESLSEDSMLFTESNNHVKLDNIETSNDMIHTNTDDFHLDKNEEINEDDFEFADDFYLDEDELPNNNSQLDESNVMDEDDYEIFDLDEDFDKDDDFNLDTPIKNEESITSHVKEKVPTKQNNDTEKDFDSYFEMADNTDYETMPIYDTQELPTSEIIKRNQEYLRQKQNNDIMPPQQEHQKSIQIKEGRPDGTNVKQKDSFFGRFFKKK